MMKSSTGIKPADNAALVLHRQGFNGCYKPVGMTCSTNAGKVSWYPFIWIYYTLWKKHSPEPDTLMATNCTT